MGSSNNKRRIDKRIPPKPPNTKVLYPMPKNKLLNQRQKRDNLCHSPIKQWATEPKSDGKQAPSPRLAKKSHQNIPLWSSKKHVSSFPLHNGKSEKKRGTYYKYPHGHSKGGGSYLWAIVLCQKVLDSWGNHQRVIVFQSKERNITAYLYSYRPCLSHTVIEDVNFFYKVKNNHTILVFWWTTIWCR